MVSFWRCKIDSIVISFYPFQLCEERSCQEEVCLLALNYMDRYLIRKEVKKNHLQLLAAACLLLASKLREPSCHCLNADTLVYFTDNSIKKFDLIVSTIVILCMFMFSTVGESGIFTLSMK